MQIAIFGTGRNGSTLLGHLMDGLQDTYVHPIEERFLTPIDDLITSGRVSVDTQQNARLRPLKHPGTAAPIELLDSYYANSLSTFFQEYVAKCDRTQHIKPVTLKEMFPADRLSAAQLVDGYMRYLGDLVRPDLRYKHWLFKCIETPYIADYERQFPEMKFVHLFRDPITNCSSSKRSVLEHKQRPASYLGNDWLVTVLRKRWIPHARFVLANRSNPRHYIVRYEDIVKDPIGQLGAIAAWLGLKPPARSDTQTLFSDLDFDWDFNASKKGVKTPAKAVSDFQKKNQYEEILTEREIDLIHYITAPYLVDLGYPAVERPGRARLMREYLVPDRWDLMNCNTPAAKLKGLYGMLYRRLEIFRN